MKVWTLEDSTAISDVTTKVLHMLFDAGVSVSGRRLEKAAAIYSTLSSLERERVRLCIVPYTYNTQRFAQYQCRIGRAEKIGSGGQHRGQKPFLIFMDWSEEK